MKVYLRIPRQICELMRIDLARPHAFADERIGFARAMTGMVAGGIVVLLNAYLPIPDDQYLEDPNVGARINGAAIRGAMQDILDHGVTHGMFHVHMHFRRGRTGMSRTDAEEIPKLVRSFGNLASQVPHGLLILTPDHAFAKVLLPGASGLHQVDKTIIVGYPMEILK